MMCSTCGQPAERYKPKSNQCKDCIYKKQLEWRRKNRPRIKSYADNREKKYSEAQKRATMRWREKNRKKYNEYHRQYQEQLKLKKDENS